MRAPDGAQLVIVDGRAGYGKSTVTSEVSATLEAQGWFVAVARMDTDQSMSTSEDLGHAMGLTESPSVLLNTMPRKLHDWHSAHSVYTALCRNDR